MKQAMKRTFTLLCGMMCAIAAWGQDAASSTWAAVQARAAASGDPKAIWRELKQLSPAELLDCGRAFSDESRASGAPPEAGIVFVNAILSYHKDKTGWRETAEAVGRIVAESGNPHWVYGALEWIENNDHWRDIPPEGFRAIAAGMSGVLARPDASPDVFLVVLEKCGSFDITWKFPPEDLARATAQCREILQAATDEKVRRAAGFAVRNLERIAAGDFD